MAKREMTTHELAEFLEMLSGLLRNHSSMPISTLLEIIKVSSELGNKEARGAALSNWNDSINKENNFNDQDYRNKIIHDVIMKDKEPPNYGSELFEGVPKTELIALIENSKIPIKWSKHDSIKVLVRRLQNYLNENPEEAKRLQTSNLATALRLLRNL